MSKTGVTFFTQKPLFEAATSLPDVLQGPALRVALEHVGATMAPGAPRGENKSIPIPDLVISRPICQDILYDDIADSRVRVWDLIILVPNAVFLAFLLVKLGGAVSKLRHTNSPIFTAFYMLVFSVAVISVLRCVVSMTVNASVLAGDIADKVLWLILRFFLLATELSIVIFGLAFGHLDSKRSIQRVLAVTSCIALLYSCTQGTLEFTYPDPNFQVKQSPNSTIQDYDIFGHGGMIFWLTSSLFFFLVYTVIFILPWTSLREKLALPPKRSFYRYAAFLAALNAAQAVGSALIYSSIQNGMCVVDVTTYIYFTCFAPVVYLVFLRKFFRMSQPSILFSYKNQVDEAPEEDTVSMPYQATARMDDSDSIAGSYDSTHFDRNAHFQKILLPNGAGSVNVVEVDVNPNMDSSSDFYQGSA
ncbi:transmembrane protein adipocyte-associated 1 homolog [Argopecten irradians]|uniref:transmembrane protein adipocyte-associated 1 homolog n=1 Tax=Argopecten irradians TaxID=31199 RepID=UPI0037196B7C